MWWKKRKTRMPFFAASKPPGRAVQRHARPPFQSAGLSFPCAYVRGGGGEKEEEEALCAWMRRWVALHCALAAAPLCLAVVFDVDHTLLDGAGRAKAEMVSFYAWCLERGVECHVVTARGASARNEAATREQLRAAGVTSLSSLRLMPAPPGGASITPSYVAAFKAGARREVSRSSSVLLNVGDQWTDFAAPEESAALLGAAAANNPFRAGVLLPPSHAYPFVKLRPR